MNILFFLTPKQDVSFVYDDYTIEQALQVMERRRYKAIPVLRRNGSYAGTLTEGDLLWGIRRIHGGDFQTATQEPLGSISHHRDNSPVQASTSMDDLLEKAEQQSFVPVIDDRGMFIGIITRRSILKYLTEKVSPEYKG